MTHADHSSCYCIVVQQGLSSSTIPLSLSHLQSTNSESLHSDTRTWFLPIFDVPWLKNATMSPYVLIWQLLFCARVRRIYRVTYQITKRNAPCGVFAVKYSSMISYCPSGTFPNIAHHGLGRSARRRFRYHDAVLLSTLWLCPALLWVHMMVCNTFVTTLGLWTWLAAGHDQTYRSLALVITALDQICVHTFDAYVWLAAVIRRNTSWE